MAYRYIAYTPQGKQVQGRLEAPSEQAAEDILWKQQYTVVSLREIRESSVTRLLQARVTTRDLIVFSRQLATLIESGIPIVRALQLLQEQMTNKRLREILGEIAVDIQQGKLFSESLARHKGVFPALYGRLIEVGEHAGNLEMVLRQMAIYMEKEEALIRKVRGAMTYPTVVTVIAIGVAILMLTVALPPLMTLFTNFDAELPLPTRLLLALTDFFSTYRLYIFGGIVLLAASGFLFVRSDVGRPIFDRTVLKIPLIGQVIVQGAVARMCRSMSTLLRAGISVPEILDMITRSQSNTVLRQAMEEVHSELLQGHGLAGPLGQQKVFSGMLVQMVRVGEETGSLDSNLETLAVFYEDEVDRAVTALTGALEPALTIFIGVMVGFVAVSIIMPMYSLMGAIQ
ncbi:MAG TPA: type II secretion system F family protein [Chloroflexi bacterium]|jgi:type IV pilus assembly protein PilC|nr:type II secretion system F family protein [Chloroflexota bacterium]